MLEDTLRHIPHEDKEYVASLLGEGEALLSLAQALAQEEDWRIRYLLADNPRAPLEILQGLAQDGDPRVRWAALRNLERRRRKEVARILNSLYSSSQEGANPSVGEEDLLSLLWEWPRPLLKVFLDAYLTTPKSQTSRGFLQELTELVLHRFLDQPYLLRAFQNSLSQEGLDDIWEEASILSGLMMEAMDRGETIWSSSSG